jgi:hypothetical protein
MKVLGYEVPQHVLDGAFCFMRREPFSSAMLQGTIERLIPSTTKGDNGANYREIAMRTADRLVQTEKKAGRLVKDKKFYGTQFWTVKEPT